MKSISAEAFLVAVSNGKLAECDAFLSGGGDINIDLDGRTALHSVAHLRALTGFKWLIDKRAKLDQLDKFGLTPLMVVCGSGGKKGCQMAMELIQAGADVTVRRPGDSMSALEFAAKSADPAVIKALVKGGALIDGAPGANQFPALSAARAGALENLKTLIELGCDLKRKTNLQWAKDMTCLGVARLERKTAIVKYLESIGAP